MTKAQAPAPQEVDNSKRKYLQYHKYFQNDHYGRFISVTFNYNIKEYKYTYDTKLNQTQRLFAELI